MYCRKCGREIKNDSKYCPGCGFPTQKIQKVYEEEMQSEAKKKQQKENRKQRGGLKKLIYAVIAGIVCVVIIGMAVFMLKHKNEDKSYDEYMEEAQQYLDELKYVEAEEALNQAIEIKPTEKAPYIILAEVYVKDDKPSEAEEVLERALDKVEMDDSEVSQVKQYIENVRNGLEIETGTEDTETVTETSTEKDGGENAESYITIVAPTVEDTSSSYGDIEILNGPDNELGDGIYVRRGEKTLYLTDEDSLGFYIVTNGKNIVIYSVIEEMDSGEKVKIYRYNIDNEESECIAQCTAEEYFQLAGYYDKNIYYIDGIGGGSFNSYSEEEKESYCLLEYGAGHVWQSNEFFILQSNTATAEVASELQVYNAATGECNMITQQQCIRGNMLCVTDDAVYYVECADPNNITDKRINVNIGRYLLDGSGNEIVISNLTIQTIKAINENQVEYWDEYGEEQVEYFD